MSNPCLVPCWHSRNAQGPKINTKKNPLDMIIGLHHKFRHFNLQTVIKKERPHSHNFIYLSIYHLLLYLYTYLYFLFICLFAFFMLVTTDKITEKISQVGCFDCVLRVKMKFVLHAEVWKIYQ